jgi:hypothetical protein
VSFSRKLPSRPRRGGAGNISIGGKCPPSGAEGAARGGIGPPFLSRVGGFYGITSGGYKTKIKGTGYAKSRLPGGVAVMGEKVTGSEVGEQQ